MARPGRGRRSCATSPTAGPPRAVWRRRAGRPTGRDLLAHAAAATYASGRGALVCVPDGKDVERVDRALAGCWARAATSRSPPTPARPAATPTSSRSAAAPAGSWSAPARRRSRRSTTSGWWRSGTTATTCTPSPARRTRTPARRCCCAPSASRRAALVGGFARTRRGAVPPAQRLGRRSSPRRGRCCASAPGSWWPGPATTTSTATPRAAAARMPGRSTTRSARRSARARCWSRPPRRVRRVPGLRAVPHAGAVRDLLGPAGDPLPADPPACRWCATPAAGWACPACGHHGLRAPVLGDARTAEELGRSFPRTRVRTSSGDARARPVDDRAAIVVATPGAEPVAERRVRRRVLLDTWLLLARPTCARRRRRCAAGPTPPGSCAPGGRVVVVGDPPTRRCRRWCAGTRPGFAARETAERVAAHLPPACRLATITGSPGRSTTRSRCSTPPPGAEVLGPVEVGRGGRRVAGRRPGAAGPGTALSRSLGDLQRLRSSRKLEAVRIQVDPPSIG